MERKDTKIRTNKTTLIQTTRKTKTQSNLKDLKAKHSQLDSFSIAAFTRSRNSFPGLK